jgi:succinoglycan biosynthesis protein ExoA
VAPIDVSVLIPVRNEERHIRTAVDAMRAQRFDGEFELIFVDGASEDGTKAILEGIATEDPRVRVLDNPARRTPQALNIALRAARGRYVARMDAHTLFPPGYLQAGVERLERGDVACVGGPQLARGDDMWSRRVALGLSTRLGMGGAEFRRELPGELEVDSVFAGMWRKETLDREGGWDEEWLNDQDLELAARLRKDGGRIVCLPQMAADYVPRNSLRALWKQYWVYGQYRVKTSVRHPESMRRSQVLPPGLTLCLGAAAVAPGRPLRRLARLGAASYAAALTGTAAQAATDGASPRDAASLLLVLPTMHLAYGSGFLRGCVAFGVPLEALARVAGLDGHAGEEG